MYQISVWYVFFRIVGQKQYEKHGSNSEELSIMDWTIVILVVAAIAAGGLKISIGDINIGNTRKDDTK